MYTVHYVQSIGIRNTFIKFRAYLRYCPATKEGGQEGYQLISLAFLHYHLKWSFLCGVYYQKLRSALWHCATTPVLNSTGEIVWGTITCKTNIPTLNYVCKIGLRLRIVHVVDICSCRYLILVQTITVHVQEETNKFVIAVDDKVGAMQVAGL